MSETQHPEWQSEQERVTRIAQQIKLRTEQLQEQSGTLHSDIVGIRNQFWDDVTVNFEDDAEAAETYASIKQQAEVLSERERSHRHVRAQLATLQRLQRSPYFGRIDFAENGQPATERIYVGIGSFLNDAGDEFLIYDWRAPVSSLYYDYAPGPASYTTPFGVIEGMMELKRQFIIRDGLIRSLFDTGVTIGDELLQQVLGKQADTQMRSIVATIQREQNRIIRNTGSRLLIVRGAAGSGKTSAALQRVAYLLYRFRETLKSEHIVLFSPNPMFNSYVSTVLPELGEENMQQTTFLEYLEHRLTGSFEVENPYVQLEYAMTSSGEPGYEARMAGIRLKTGTGFLQAMDRYAEALSASGLRFKPLMFRGGEVVSASEIAELFYGLDRSWSIPNRMKALADELLKLLKVKAKAERHKPWVEDEIELLDKEAYMEAYEALRRKNGFTETSFNDFDREQVWLASTVVQGQFKPLRTDVKRLRFLDVPAVYRQWLEAFGAEDFALGEFPGWSSQLRAAMAAQTIGAMEQGTLTYEDATPYLYLKEKLEGFQTNNAVRHVFIDEAQDYSPFQFAFLKRLFPRSRMTVLGDTNQAIHAHAAEQDGFAALAALFPSQETESIVLTRSYRSTRPIVEFTRHLLKEGGEAIEPFHREGNLPTVTRAANGQDRAARMAERIRLLQADGHETIAVICQTARESREAYDALSPLVEARLIDVSTRSYDPGLLIIPSYLAKGVEFDAVLLYEASASTYGRESERKLFYTSCTRAMHELHIYYTGEISPFLAGLPTETFEQ